MDSLVTIFFFFYRVKSEKPHLPFKERSSLVTGNIWGRGRFIMPPRISVAWALGTRERRRDLKKKKEKRRPLLPIGQLCLSAGCCDPLVTIKMKCPSAAIFSVWSICF